MAHILLYGGTFDPIHLGHLITCRAAREMLAAERVMLIPARVSPHKRDEPPGASPEQRLEMIRLAIAGAPDFLVEPCELSREGVSYTVDTVRDLKSRRPLDHFTLLIGQDQLAKFHTWHDVRGLLEEVGIAVLRRSGANTLPPEKAIAAVRERLGPQTAEHIQQALLNTPLIDISSTLIRQRIREGLPIDFLVPPAVGVYLEQNRLYR